jgi:CHAP domain-containing protein
MNPLRAVPWDEEHRCDCSGFVMWCLGFSRKQGAIWYGTDRIRLDAIDGGTLFAAVPWEEAEIGDLLVYGERKDGDGVARFGHVGIVSAIADDGPSLVVHCSHGNWIRHGDAIREEAPGLFQAHPESVVARCLALERVPAA